MRDRADLVELVSYIQAACFSSHLSLPLSSEEWGLVACRKGGMDEEPCYPKPMHAVQKRGRNQQRGQRTFVLLGKPSLFPLKTVGL